jgi:hypothetical protein
MNDKLKFEKMKNIFSEILIEKLGDLSESDDLAINYKRNMDEKFQTRLHLLNQAINFLDNARSEKDELATQTALLILRSQSMGLADFFNAIVNDIESILNKPKWIEIPEDYKIPEHYNFNE